MQGWEPAQCKALCTKRGGPARYAFRHTACACLVGGLYTVMWLPSMQGYLALQVDKLLHARIHHGCTLRILA